MIEKMRDDQYQWICNRLSEVISRLPAKEKAAAPSDAADCSAFTDTERLDWMQATHETVWRVSYDERRPTTDPANPYETVEVFEGWTVDDPDNPKPTIREAIDHFILSHNDKGLATQP